MKIKELFNKAKGSKSVRIVDTADENGEITRQHIVIDDAVYPLDGIPRVNEETVLAILDVPADMREEWHVFKGINKNIEWMLEDEQSADLEAKMGKMELECGGVKYRTFHTARGMLFVSNEQLRPIKDEKNVCYRLRENGNAQMIIAQRGMMNIGALMPLQWADEEAADELWQMAEAARKIAEKRKLED